MFTVVGQRVLVKPDPLENEVKSIKGFVIARPGDLEKAERAAVGSGVVVELGNVAYKDIADGTPWCKPGDHIIYARHAGKSVIDPETQEEYVIILDQDVQAIIGTKKKKGKK